MSVAPSKCCRSNPRCARCPVLLARRRPPRLGAEGLVTEILLGTAPRLPPAVLEQLELLEAAQRPRRLQTSAS